MTILVILFMTILVGIIVILVPKDGSYASGKKKEIEQPVPASADRQDLGNVKIEIVETSEESVPVIKTEEKIEKIEESEIKYTEEELEILSIIIYQEAGGDESSDDTRLKVGNVFLNRVNGPYFPNTFEEVATQKSQYGTLYWTGIKWPERASNPGEAHAVQRSYDTAKKLLEGERVLPENVIWQAEFPQGDGTYCYQDGIYFCYSEVDE